MNALIQDNSSIMVKHCPFGSIGEKSIEVENPNSLLHREAYPAGFVNGMPFGVLDGKYETAFIYAHTDLSTLGHIPIQADVQRINRTVLMLITRMTAHFDVSPCRCKGSAIDSGHIPRYPSNLCFRGIRSARDCSAGPNAAGKPLQLIAPSSPAMRKTAGSMQGMAL